MPNPLINGGIPQNNNPFNNLMQFLNGGGNPKQLVEQVLGKNPQANQTIQQLKNMAGGKSPKDFAMQLAKQRGIDPKQLQQIAEKMGLK